MKKLSIVLTAIVMLFATSSFATAGTEVSATVKAAFTKDFSSAINVGWEKKSDFYFADFKLNEKSVTAAYNENGELVGTARKMDITQLPLSVALSLAKNYGGFALNSDVTEITFEGVTSYLVTANNAKQMLSLKCSGNGTINVESKTRK